MIGDMKISVSKYLPKTVKDKDGNEVELIGIMTADKQKWDRWMADLMGQTPCPQIVLLTGNVVRRE